MQTAIPLRFSGPSATRLSALLTRPTAARWLLVLGHGAGAGMRHPFLERMAAELAARRIATLRYQFPYRERGHRRPDPAPVLRETVRAAVRAGHEAVPELPLLAGGKSMGGRMTSLAASEAALPGVRGLVFLGFPLHPAGRPSTERAEHLHDVNLPSLFLQGTRDRLAELALLEPLAARLGDRVTLRIVEGADHSFRVLKRSGHTEDEVFAELATAVERWTEALSPAAGGSRASGRPGTPGRG
ncbi:MAG: alpha/beta family hydrolase [Gemmatimonadota bacterium]